MAPEQEFQKEVLTTLHTLKKDVETLHKELHELKMNYEDSTLTEDEKKLIEEAHADMKAGRLVPSREVKKKLGL
ncbi:TPA: hypothetical protein H1012_01000 [archaeon]|nr:hypothetical protein [Candidatus Naiadarchaeales archaeon SRR2090153.bin461]HIK02408.1 hypothetical protein [Candidatus Naiadarchaeales archaeon SRR2090159.bin1288]